MADSILDAVTAAADQLESGGGDAGNHDAGTTPATRTDVAEGGAGEKPQDQARDTPDRARDGAGRFAKAEDKPRETLTLKDPKAGADTAKAQVDENAAGVAAAKPGAEQPKLGDERIAPPPDWKGAGKVQWDRLPKAVQAELRDTYQGLATARAEFEPLQRAIAPHAAILQRDAGSFENGMNQLMQFYNLFLTNPQGLIQHIARTRGIDLAAPQSQPGQPDTTQVPDIDSRIAQAAQQAVAPFYEQMRQAETHQTNQTIEAFRADPAHPYFNDVRVTMGHLMQAGQAKDMQDAYDKATWADPVIRQTLLSQQAEDTKNAQAAAVEKARKASAVNLNGSPTPGAAVGGGRKGESALDTVRRVMAEAEGA